MMRIFLNIKPCNTTSEVLGVQFEAFKKCNTPSLTTTSFQASSKMYDLKVKWKDLSEMYTANGCQKQKESQNWGTGDKEPFWN